jgi:hypothetical protein
VPISAIHNGFSPAPPHHPVHEVPETGVPAA